ncbi:MAG: Holliday junction resolvase RecU [Eubacterium sp.]|nr:Holliday junction resolvase RecU [Eubacterium sp.]
MGHWSSKGLRGSTLEEMINSTNDKYREQGLALIQKIPTPITPVEIDQKSRRITKAYFEKQSTVDYIGTVQGIPVCFDAKECGKDTYPLMNIHEHQIQFMKDFEKQGGISFIVLMFTHKNEIYYLPFRDVLAFYERGENGGRKSFTYDEIDKSYLISQSSGVLVHYLEQLQKDILSRDE